MERETPYRNITSEVRTPRFAVLVDKNEIYWKAFVNGIIQSVSQTWGGEYFIIIPTDGKTIDEKFWDILEAYNPDKIGRYIPNLLDMEEADTEAYAQVKDNYRRAWKLPEDEFEKHWSESVKSGNIGGLKVDKTLSEELKNRLSPFYFQDHIVGENVFRDSSLGFPFTQIEHIVESAKDRPTKVTVPLEIEDGDYRLLALSRSGALTEAYLEKLKSKGFTPVSLPANSKAFREKDYLTALEKNEYDLGWQRAFSDTHGNEVHEYPEEDFLPNLPFKLSMLHLGKYHRRDTHFEEKENVLVVIGDTFEDYCLYYSLSRIHEGVHWLPDHHLAAAYRKHTKNAKRKNDDEIEKYTKDEDIAASLVNEYFSIIKYGHSSKNLDITSYSLTTRQLENRKKWQSEICWTSKQEFLNKINVLPLDELKVNCVMRVIEVNNHANQQDMIFQNGKSVGRVNTPKPKNFSPVNPAEHRWITTLKVDKYSPPVLPFLGSKIIELRQMSYETRVANDGLAYLCPNIGYFGGDIDVNTVRPELHLLNHEELFSEYFTYSGFSMGVSDKGSYLNDTIDRFGSLEVVAKFFREARNREMLGQFLFTKTESDGDDEVVFLDTERRSYLSFKAFSRKLGTDEETIIIIDDLINKDILRRGLVFQCDRCRLTSWYGVEEVGRDFKCKRCDFVQPYSHKNWKWSDEPRWYYRLAETVYQFYRSSSHLTALSLDKLRQEAPDEFHYISETDLLDPLGKVKKRELDVLAIAKGNIIIGECKDCPPIAADITKYKTLFSQLAIKPYQFLLATTEESVTPQVQAALDKFKNHRLFTKNDLYDS